MSESVFAAAQRGSMNFELCRRNSFAKILNRNRPTTPAGDTQHEKMWSMMAEYIPLNQKAIQKAIVNHAEYTLAKNRFNFQKEDCYRATAYSVRDRLIEILNDTSQQFFDADVKRCYYLSLEFLMGRALQNALVNMDIEEEYGNALRDLGFNLEELYEYEHDAALGNGGLGRLAACFLDSMATLNLPCWGYGIRYTYGIFEQKIHNGRQVEFPDYWLVEDNPWEVARHDVTYAVRFFGESQPYEDEGNRTRWRWVGGEIVQAMAHDNPVPGFDTYNCINLRLWKAIPAKEFDFHSFNEGNYLSSVAERQDAEAISAVLYPNDNKDAGKLLRLKQQYFFCCATMQDALRRFKRRKNYKWEDLPNRMAVQLNDTHPTVAIPELMRILVDIECLEWDAAWDIVRNVFNYTNHTVLPEALEKWPIDLFGKLLPRHLQIVYEINFRFLADVSRVLPGDCNALQELSLVEEGDCKKLRMANLAFLGSTKVNGVAALHTDILRRTIFHTFGRYIECATGEPVHQKILNMTNGVTPRRWLHCCNRGLSDLISQSLGGDDWLTDMTKVSRLIADDPMISEWARVKLANKRRLARWLKQHCKAEVDPNTMLFDVQVKRIHEYKRQLLFLLYVIHRWLSLKRGQKLQARACLLGGKAAPGYAVAKTVIKLCNSIASVINNDPDTADCLKLIFMPNYNVSAAEVIIPGTDLSEQISTAGMEASGTSCMKFVMNGALLMGTLDGANVEIREECGDDTMFVFGLREDQVDDARRRAREGHYPIDSRLQEVFDCIRGGAFANGDPAAQDEFTSLIARLLNNGHGHNGDYYLLLADFADYCRAQDDADKLYKNQVEWTRLAIKAASRMGKFSSDRTVKEYAEQIWKIEPCPVSPPEKKQETSPLLSPVTTTP